MTLWSICFKYHLPKTRWEKLDDIAHTFVDIVSSKTLYKKPQKGKTHIKKRVQCIICPNIIHQKPFGKNGWYDIVLCRYYLIKKLYMRNPKEKNSYKKRVHYDIFNKLLIRETRDSPPKTCKLFVPMYSTHMKCGIW